LPIVTVQTTSKAKSKVPITNALLFMNLVAYAVCTAPYLQINTKSNEGIIKRLSTSVNPKHLSS